jgi:hypothetical protein
MAEFYECFRNEPPDAVVASWAAQTVANILYAPEIAVRDALEIAREEPRSLVRLRQELEWDEPRKWRAIKHGRVLSLAEDAIQTVTHTNIAGRVYLALSKQGAASHLQAILSGNERRAILDLLQILRTARRASPMGGEYIPGACSLARKSRTKGPFARILASRVHVEAFRAGEYWLGTNPACVSVSVFGRVLCGDPAALEILAFLRAYATGDWRWRFLLGALLA